MFSTLSSFLRARVGSNTYYQKEEIVLERLSAEISRLEAHLSQRSKRLSAWTSAVRSYGVAGFFLAAALAASASRAAPGTYTPREHLARVAPLFVEPLVVLAALALVRSLGSAVAARDEGRLRAARRRLREAVADLKDSTRFERTMALLVKYDPETRAAAARQARAKAALAAEEEQEKKRRMTQMNQRQGSSADASTSSRALAVAPGAAAAGASGKGGGGGLVSAALASAGGGVASALDRLAAAAVGDNPSLTRALDDARREAATLRGALLQVSAENERLRSREALLSLRAAAGEGVGGGSGGASWQQEQLQQHQLPALTLEEIPDSPKGGVAAEEEEGSREKEEKEEEEGSREKEEKEEEEAAEAAAEIKKDEEASKKRSKCSSNDGGGGSGGDDAKKNDDSDAITLNKNPVT